MTDTSPPSPADAPPDAHPGGATTIDAPTTDPQRLVSLDVLRGFAVLGILVMNIQSFAMIDAAYANPTAMGPLAGADYWVWLASHVLAEQKFMTIFSVLFGCGIVMMADRQEAKGRPAAPLHYRRMGWLLVIGLAHAYLVWFGDILVTYAVCGLIVFLFRNARPWTLVAIGALSLTLASLITLLIGLALHFVPPGDLTPLKQELWAPSAEQIEQQVAAYRGSWLSQLPHRAATAIGQQTFVLVLVTGWRAGGLMVIGMALWKWGVLSASRRPAFYAALAALGALVGFPLVAYGAYRNLAAGIDFYYALTWGAQYNYWGSLGVSLAYIAVVMLLCQSPRALAKLQPLAAVGQMALTNYLMHSVICTLIFYGHGLGYFGSFSRVEQLLTVLAIWALQLVASPIWLSYFRFGPFEWVWRSLSYRRWQPIRRGQRTLGL